jgi:hypothetical protein
VYDFTAATTASGVFDVVLMMKMSSGSAAKGDPITKRSAANAAIGWGSLMVFSSGGWVRASQAPLP